ncbi:hypothetical protein GE061_016781 [Apolygus lucorum]|uniref:Peptidase S1 domain-containing protein n=1 Tax=Apolygus lucorum TaxID=248454 RepID=A0A6A4JVK0_APOLU|nr:hypothetical protein GE061_016781 [Apolygus lucorum]
MMFAVYLQYFSIIVILVFSSTNTVISETGEILRVTHGVVPIRGEFPYHCTVVHNQKWIGSCSILSSKYVTVSVSNMKKPVSIKEDEEKLCYNDIGGLTVYAGSTHMNPSVLQNSVDGMQKVKVDSLYIAYNASDLSLIQKILPDNKDFNLLDVLAKDVVDAAFNVAFLKVEELRWTFYVRHVPLSHEILSNKGKAFEDAMWDIDRKPYRECKIASWHLPTSRRIFHRVIHVPIERCKRAFCNYNLNACLKFPSWYQLVCFKSATWGEPCASDTGSALFCKFFFGGNVFAILTTSINCGTDNLPCIYTSMLPVLQIFEQVQIKFD